MRTKDERARLIVERWRSGETQQSIAPDFGISRERVSQIIKATVPIEYAHTPRRGKKRPPPRPKPYGGSYRPS